MSLEIRELIIKATVVPDSGVNANNASPGNGNAPSGEEMINTCVEKVLEILKEKNGR